MRTEEEKLLKAPIVVELGGKEYEVKPLVIKEARIWRQKLAQIVAKLPGYANASTSDPEAFESAVTSVLVAMPDAMADLFFDYAKDLPRDEIEENASEFELAEALNKVMEVALPLVGSVAGAMGKVGH